MTGPGTGTSAVGAHRWHRATDYETLARDIQFRNAALLARLHPNPGGVRRVYEIGCGTGALTRCLAERLPHATIDAVDVSEQMLEAARRQEWSSRVTFHRASFPDVPPERPYDCVYSNAALHWMYPRYDQVFRTIHTILRPGGLLCAACAARTAGTESFAARLRDRLPGLAPESGADDFERRRLTAAQVAELAGRSGLVVEDAFVVERSTTVPVHRYARWWVASGGPWRSDQRSPDGSIQEIIDGLGGGDAALDMVHASVFMLMRRPA